MSPIAIHRTGSDCQMPQWINKKHGEIMNCFCGDCGFMNDANAEFCESCGTKLKMLPSRIDDTQTAGQELPALTASLAGEVPGWQTNASSFATNALDQGKRLASATHAKVRSAHPHKFKAVAVIGATLIAWILLEFSHERNAPPSGWNYLAWTTFLLTLVPMSCGALMMLISGSITPNWFIKFSAWMDQRAAGSRVSGGRFNRFIARPALWSCEALDERASRIDDDMLRNGARVATYAFSVILFCLLLFWIAVLAITVVMLVIGIAITIFIIDAWDGTTGNSRRITGAMSAFRSSEGKVYSGTNVFNEQVTGRVDEDGNVYEGSNFFNEQKVGRIDAEGNRYEGTNVFNEQKVGRTDEEGNVHEGTNFFNERKTGRVDEAGNIYEGTNVFNERKVGRVEKK